MSRKGATVWQRSGHFGLRPPIAVKYQAPRKARLSLASAEEINGPSPETAALVAAHKEK